MKRAILPLAVFALILSGCTTEPDPEATGPSITRTGILSSSNKASEDYYQIGPFSGVNKNSSFSVAVQANSSSPWVVPVYFVEFIATGQAYVLILDNGYTLWDYMIVATP